MTIKQKFETIQELAAYYDSFFEIRTRDNGETFVCLKDDRPDELRDLIREAHEGKLPDDWIYQKSRDILCHIAEGYDPSEIEPDIYTHELIEWLKGNTHLFDEALEESELKDFASIAQFAQSREISSMASIIEYELERILNEQEEESETEEND